MESLSHKEENILKNVRNLVTLKKELNYTAMNDIRNLFRLQKETKAIKKRILRGIKNLFEHEEEIYGKPVRVSSFWSNNYIEYECSDDKNERLEEYLNKVILYLKHIMNNFKKCDMWKNQLPVANNFISSIDNNE